MTLEVIWFPEWLLIITGLSLGAEKFNQRQGFKSSTNLSSPATQHQPRLTKSPKPTQEATCGLLRRKLPVPFTAANNL